MNDNADLVALSGISPEYASLLEASEISDIETLRERLSTDETRKLVSWQTGIAEKLLLEWYQQSYDEYDPSAKLTADGLSDEEAEMLVESVDDESEKSSSVIAPDGALPLTTTDGRRVQDGPIYKLSRRVAHLKVFTFSTLGVLVLLLAFLLSGFISEATTGDELSLEPTLGAGSSSSVRTTLADGLFQEGKYEEAELEYRQSLLLEPDSVSARTGLGRTLYRMGRYSDAAAQLERAIKTDSMHFEAHYFLSNVHIKTPDLKRAIQEARIALELLPEHPWAAYNLALAHHMSEKKLRLTEEEVRLATSTLIQELMTSDGKPGLESQTVSVLRTLTGESFGHDATASPEERRNAIQRWSEWWAQESQA